MIGKKQMKQFIIMFGFLALTNTPLQYAMEHSYGITENAIDIILSQQHLSHKAIGFLASKRKEIMRLSLEKMHTGLCTLSDTTKYIIIKRMPKHMSLLTYAAACLPQEIVQQICLYMMDGEIPSGLEKDAINAIEGKITKAAEMFYTTPIKQALKQYNDVAMYSKDNPKQPLGSLYVMPQKWLGAISEIQTSPYAIMPQIINEETHRLLANMPDEDKHLYIKNKIVILNENDLFDLSNPKELAQACAMSIGLGSGIFVAAESIAGIVGVVLNVGCDGCACNPVILGTTGGFSALCCIWNFSLITHNYLFSKQTTL